MRLGLGLSIAGRADPIDYTNPVRLADRLFSQYEENPSAWYEGLVRETIVALVDEGVFAKYDTCLVGLAESKQGSLLNWTPRNDNPEELGTLTWSAAGWDPDGAGSGFLAAAQNGKPGYGVQLNDAHLGVWFNEGVPLAGPLTSNDAGGANGKLSRHPNGTQDQIRANHSSNVNVTAPATGDKLWSRTGASEWRYFVDGVVQGGDPRTDAATVLNENWYFGRLSSTAFGVNAAWLYRCGAGLTPAEVTAEHAIWADFKAAFEAGP